MRKYSIFHILTFFKSFSALKNYTFGLNIFVTTLKNDFIINGNLSGRNKCQYRIMKIKSFFKLVNRKINKYDKAASNPFEAIPLTITLVWIEEENPAPRNNQYN